MTDKELKKLKRAELLEILLFQRQKIDDLEKQVAELTSRVEDRRISLGEVGSIAEASLALSNVFAEAQKAADLYLYNVKVLAGEETPESQETPQDGQ